VQDNFFGVILLPVPYELIRVAGYSGSAGSYAILPSVSSPRDSVEDRIRELCALAASAPESEWEPIVDELKSLIHEHVTRARTLAKISFPKHDDAA
jgi:hypothetical protein